MRFILLPVLSLLLLGCIHVNGDFLVDLYTNEKCDAGKDPNRLGRYGTNHYCDDDVWSEFDCKPLPKGTAFGNFVEMTSAQLYMYGSKKDCETDKNGGTLPDGAVHKYNHGVKEGCHSLPFDMKEGTHWNLLTYYRLVTKNTCPSGITCLPCHRRRTSKL